MWTIILLAHVSAIVLMNPKGESWLTSSAELILVDKSRNIVHDEYLATATFKILFKRTFRSKPTPFLSPNLKQLVADDIARVFAETEEQPTSEA